MILEKDFLKAGNRANRRCRSTIQLKGYHVIVPSGAKKKVSTAFSPFLSGHFNTVMSWCTDTPWSP